MNKKNKIPSQEQPAYLASTIMDHPTMHWIQDNSKNLAWGAVILLLLLIALYRMGSSNTAQVQNDYIAAQHDFNTLANFANKKIDAEEKEKAVQNLESILKRQPDLNAKYEGWLAQALINQGQPDKALPYAQGTLKRIEKDQLPAYSSFASISLDIEKKEYEKALAQSIALKNQLLKEEDDQTLQAFNLMRIAILYQLMEKKGEESVAWKDFLEHAKTVNPSAPNAYRMIMDNFNIGNVTLGSYIESREKLLQPQS